MSTLTPKQVEIHRRSQQVLEVARDLFREHGYLGLNMDGIAARIGVAKGTIYQHFRNKEEVILALATETLEKRIGLFEQASVFRGRPRERMAAIGCAAELFVQRFPDHFELEKVLSCRSIIEKTALPMQHARAAAEMKCISLVGGIVRDGVASGDLDLPEGFSPDKVVFGLWSISFGGYSIMGDEAVLEQLGIGDGFRMVREVHNRLLDGLGWKPLSSRYDYDKVFDRVRREVFHEPA